MDFGFFRQKSMITNLQCLLFMLDSHQWKKSAVLLYIFLVTSQWSASLHKKIRATYKKCLIQWEVKFV